MSNGEHWKERNVLVGVLHNPQQLEVNLACHFYHIPASLLLVEPETVKQVALYQSIRHFGRVAAGVRYFGSMEQVAKVKRGDITQIPTKRPDELYYRFAVPAWRTLERPIRAEGKGPDVSMVTNRFLLEHCRYFPELYINTWEQYLLYTSLRKACAHTIRTGGAVRMPGAEGHTVMVSGWTIGVYTPDGGHETHSLRRFFQEPQTFLRRMIRFIDLAALKEGETVPAG